MANRLRKAGFTRVIHVDGGLHAWLAAGLPVQGDGRGAMSLDSQVRLMVGLGVVVSILVGWMLHPVAYVVGVALGLSLVYTGLSGSCVLSNLLAQMPWNAVSGK